MTDATSILKLETALAEIAHLGDEGRQIFTRLYADEAREAARAADTRHSAGRTLGPLDGRLVSIKDLFDVAGESTTAGSIVRRDAPPATRDAVVVRRLRAAGAVIVGKTNMTEFAFSGVGLNPHYGTPDNTHDVTRIPGGSSSGAGVSAGRGLVEFAIGSDTGGSVRIPAALNGVVGFKPTQARVSRDGSFPLSYTLDTVGPLCRNVSDAAMADAVLAGEDPMPLGVRTVRGLRVGVPRGWVFTQAQTEVMAAFEKAMGLLSAAGACVTDESLDDLLGEPSRLQENGTMIAAEAAWIHQTTATAQANGYDPIVLSRIRKGQTISAASYVGLQQARATLLPQLDARLGNFDVLVLPTVPVLAPRISEVQTEEAFLKINALLLRNPSIFNFYDLPALSLPLPTDGGLSIGLMVVGQRRRDREQIGRAHV